jgi:hypothetical protein
MLLFSGCICGCGGDARLELASSDALLAIADQMATTIEEYHGEVSNFDDVRESVVLDALVARLKTDIEDESAVESHVSAFKSAMVKIRADRGVEWDRRSAGLDNVSLLREVAGGLQKLAMESLVLQDEMRRYLTDWLELRRRANGQSNFAGGGQ